MPLQLPPRRKPMAFAMSREGAGQQRFLEAPRNTTKKTARWKTIQITWQFKFQLFMLLKIDGLPPKKKFGLPISLRKSPFFVFACIQTNIDNMFNNDRIISEHSHLISIFRLSFNNT